MNKKAPKPTGDKRIQIMEAAAVVFSRKGFHQARVEEVALRAAVGKGTVYEYFSSKKELFHEMLIYMHQKYQGMAEEEIKKADSIVDKLRIMFYSKFTFMEKHRDVARLLLSDHPPMADETRVWFQEMQLDNLKNVALMLQEAVKRGEIREVNCDLTAQVILGSLIMTGGQLIFTDEPVDKKKIIDELLNVMLYGLMEGMEKKGALR